MKKVFTILLFVAYLFNLAGYSLLFDYFMNRTDTEITASLDNGTYNDAGLIEIKVPLHLAYAPSQMEYERWDGEIEIDGMHYNYVKRRIYNDTLYLFCIPNTSKTQLQNARTAFAAAINDITIPLSQKKQSNSLQKKISFENEYDQPNTDYLIAYTTIPARQYCILPAHLISVPSGLPEQPPDRCHHQLTPVTSRYLHYTLHTGFNALLHIFYVTGNSIS